MRVYLASRYSRRLEMLEHAEDLKALGHVVTSRWITGLHEIAGRDQKTGYSVEEQTHFAQADLYDINSSNALIAFTEPSGSPHSRGGRHVETGYALGLGLAVYVVGPRENCFCCLPRVKHFETWEAVLETLR